RRALRCTLFPYTTLFRSPINGHFVLNRSQVRVHVAQAPFRQLLPPLNDGDSHLALCLSRIVTINGHFVLNRSQVRVHVAQAPFRQLLPPLKYGESHLALCLSV